MVPGRPYVMIIDDEINLCDLLSTMLYTKNVNVLCAYTLKEAEDHIKTRPPFLLFLDNRLPDGFGIDFLARIREEHPDIKVVLITGAIDPELEQQALTEGCIGVLEKPFSYLKVSELVEQAMETQSF